jgi:hypothetical protein
VSLKSSPNSSLTSKPRFIHSTEVIPCHRYKKGTTLHGVIYFHRISNLRPVSKRSLRLFKQLCGDPTLKNVVIVVAWDDCDMPTQEQRQEDLRAVQSVFESALDQQAQLLLHDNQVFHRRGSSRDI